MKLENMMMMVGWFVNNVDKGTNIHLSKSCMPHLRANSTLTFINQWQSVTKLGATVVLVGDAYDEAQAYAKKRAIEEGRTFIPPSDHLDGIMGQGTVGMGIMRQMKGPVESNICACGVWWAYSWYCCLCKEGCSRGKRMSCHFPGLSKESVDSNLN